MAYQTVTKTSYGSRLKNSIGGIGAGFIMLIIGTVLLFWNEKRTVYTTRMLKEAESVCVELDDISTVNADFNGKMIHATGLATTEDVLTDDVFGVSANAIKLKRAVEYYQWVEHSKSETKDKIGGGQETVTTYTYDREWVPAPVNSANFADPDYQGVNETLVEIPEQMLVAGNVTFGAYRFPEALTNQMNKSVPVAVELDPEFTANYDAALKKGKEVKEGESYVHVDNSTIYLGSNPGAPAIGDVRVTFSKVLPGEVSILAKVNGDTFEKFTAKNGYSMITLDDGVVSADNMFTSEKQSNKAMGWLLRFLGFLLIYLGFRNIFDIIVSLLKVLPFLGNIASVGVGIVAFVLALVWSLIVIAIGWIVYRPVLGIILLAIAAALIVFLITKSKKAAPAAPAAPEAPKAE